MPKYRNIGSALEWIEDSNGNLVKLSPGEEKETYKFYSNPKLEKVSDSPLWNRVVSRQSITLSSTPQDVSISLGAKTILITKITGKVTVYTQSSSNTPPELYEHTDDDEIIQIEPNQKFDTLVVSGTGTCEIVEYKQ